MFDGTTFKFKVLYYLTAMSPAYILFLLQLNNKFKGKSEYLNISLRDLEISIYYLLLVVSGLIIILVFKLKKMLYKQYEEGSGLLIRGIDQLEEFKALNINQRNGQVTTFFLGNILPAVFIIESSILEATIIFLTLQILILILMLKSTDLFPNIPMIILGIDICKMNNGKYLFVLKSKEDIVKVKQIGTTENSNIYITAYKK